MANLIPLNLDKNTGRIVLSSSNHSGGGGGGSNNIFGFVHMQSTTAVQWIVNHNMDISDMITQIFTTAGEMILPDDIQIVDANTIHISFITPQNGKALLLLFEN